MFDVQDNAFGHIGTATIPVASEEIGFQILKQKFHAEVVDCLDLAAANTLSRAQLCRELEDVVETIAREKNWPIPSDQKQRLLAELPDELFGLGPIQSLLTDPDVSDILVNHAHEVFVEKKGQLSRADIVFADNNHLLRIIQRVVSHVGRRIDESSPMVDARLPDGSRINAIIPPLALDGPKLSIRRFGQYKLQLEDLVKNETISRRVATFLKAAVEARKSFLISGGTGSGKTTLLNALSGCIPDDERIVTIEDSAELLLQHRHVARLETRPANSENAGEFNQRDLVRNSLRMRPDRIIVGEVRGPEALDMLQAMNTGHEGSLTTIHANDTHDAISRLEMMVAMARLELPSPVVQSYICSGISILVHLSRLKGGARRVLRISELEKLESGYTTKDIFVYRRSGADVDGVPVGNFTALNTPNCYQSIIDAGIDLDESIFKKNG